MQKTITYRFNQCTKIEEASRQAHLNWLQQWFNGGQLWVVTDQKLQRSGADFIAQFGDLQFFIDQKSDQRGWDTDNFFIETYSVWEKRIPGWIYNRECDFISYGFVHPEDWSQLEAVYLLPLGELREWFSSVKEDYEERRVPNTSDSHGRYTTVGYLTPIEDVLDQQERLLIAFWESKDWQQRNR